MSTLLRASRSPRLVLIAALMLLAGVVALAPGQARPAAGHFEYVHQEVSANTVTQSLNDLDAQGWEVFQVVPSWQIKNENAETILAPRAFEVFGRRPVAPKGK